MRCADCGTRVESDDSFCRRCGSAVNRHDLPTLVSRSLLPVPWTVARRHLLPGVAALAMGTVLQLLRREMERRAAAEGPSQAPALLIPGQAAPQPRRRFPWSRAPKGEYEVTETVIQRRIRFFNR